MSDRVCVRGCAQRDVHYATCDDYGMREAYERGVAAGLPGVSYTPKCQGCAPRECRDGSLICDKCFGRMRALLDDAPDLLGRLQSLADPRKATPTDQPHYGSSSVEPIAPVGADILDAIAVVAQVVHGIDPADLPAISNNLDMVSWAAEMVLERHPDADGLRAGWSVQDAVDRFGVERRDRNPVVWSPATDGEIASFDVAEFGDPLVSQRDAAALVGVPDRTVRRWEKRALLVRAVTIPGPRGSRKAMYRLSEVRAVWEREGANE